MVMMFPSGNVATGGESMSFSQPAKNNETAISNVPKNMFVCFMFILVFKCVRSSFRINS